MISGSAHRRISPLARGERAAVRGPRPRRWRPARPCALTGANGAGKTSLLRAVAGLLRPERRRRSRFGRGGARGRRGARASGLHLVGHQDGLKPAARRGEELRFLAAWTGGDGGRRRTPPSRPWTWRRLLDLEVRRLSAGQRRRLALARLVASPRPLWLLDEPLAPLDAALARAVRRR